jgi:hypothetical protein
MIRGKKEIFIAPSTMAEPKKTSRGAKINISKDDINPKVNLSYLYYSPQQQQ